MKEMHDDMPHGECDSRLLLEQITDKWSVIVLANLCEEPLRFNELKRRMHGVTQKSLTQCLRKLERNGIISREVLPVSPVAVVYSMTELGHTLETPFAALFNWTRNYREKVEEAQRLYDEREGK